jgi:biotin carboxyl carrier protein
MPASLCGRSTEDLAESRLACLAQATIVQVNEDTLMNTRVTKVNFRKSGMGIDEGTVVRWLKGVGDFVQKGEVLAEIETAKAIQEVESPIAGQLTQILVPAGETTAVNTTLAMIEGEQ